MVEVYVVFCFKQKTAYEMRMSDWSSDVCSSDLFWKALADSPYVMVGATGEREHHIPMNAQLDKDAHGAFWFFTATDSRLAAGGPAMAQFAAKEIGRASCRARVCQYV